MAIICICRERRASGSPKKRPSAWPSHQAEQYSQTRRCADLHGGFERPLKRDTLVVDTTNFSDLPAVIGADENLNVIERFQRIDDQTLRYSFTVEDETVWQEPWGGDYPWPVSDNKVYEYACHEGNYSFGNIMRGARLLEQDKLAQESAGGG